MDTVKIQQVLAKGKKSGGPFANLWMKVASLPSRLYSIRVKLILPYLILTLFLAAGGIFIITSRLVETIRERFNNSVLETSRVANDGIVGYEKIQLDKLRFLVFAEGMSQAMFDKNPDQIFGLMQPVMANAQVSTFTALDTSGREIVTLGKDPKTNQYLRQQGADFSGVSIVREALAVPSDAPIDKFAKLLMVQQKAILFTSAPVRDDNHKLVGVMLVGTYLDTILEALQKQSLADHIILVDDQGSLIATDLSQDAEGFDTLVKITSELGQGTNTVPRDVSINRRPYTIAYSHLIIRQEQIGWIGVIKNREYVDYRVAQSRNLNIVLFAVGTLGIVVTGYLLSKNIANPILLLRDKTKIVAKADSDMAQHIDLKRSDEIGELADSFNAMTQKLARSFEEIQQRNIQIEQRNKQLKEINERLEATQLQLVQSEKLASIGQLTAGIVHDVKNPFAVIMGMAEVLAEDEKLEEDVRHGLKVIRESAVKGNTIVSDLLKFARQSKPEMRTMDIRETVQTSMRLTAYLTRRYNTTADLPQTSLMVTYDAQQVEQVLINMIHNAVQAMPNGGSLRIGLKKVDVTAQISIQDTGCGISPEHLQRIFDPFFTTKPEGEGTGLGLSVSYGIITNHHGKINVESEPGKGTTFTILLPITQASAEASAADSAAPTLYRGDLHT